MEDVTKTHVGLFFSDDPKVWHVMHYKCYMSLDNLFNLCDSLKAYYIKK